MANLVAPINLLENIEQKTIEFRGINRKSQVEDGEMQDMLNLASDKYPLLAPRKLRGTYTMPEDVLRPLHLLTRYNKVAMITRNRNGSIDFYFDNLKVDEVNDLTESTTMVAINTKIVFYPQKKYLEVVKDGSDINIGDYESLEYSFDNSGGGLSSAVSVTIGQDETVMTFQSPIKFGYDDAININGELIYTAGGSQHSSPCIVSCTVLDADDNSITLPGETFIELVGEGVTSATFTGTIKRTIPDLDFIIEWNNRLWGCSNKDNTIYASKLGDPKNWQYFQGTSLDSFYAQQGTDGEWTGAAPYSGHLIFFKESSMCKIYGTAPNNYQVVNVECYGIEEGSRLSAVTINDTVFYKSTIGIMAYDGSIPYCISEKFNCRFKNVIGGTEGTKYYASIQVEDGGYELMVLDIDRAVWHKEDGTRFRDTCTVNNRLNFITYEDDQQYCQDFLFCNDYLVIGSEDAEGYIGICNPIVASESYDTMPWAAEFGPFDEYIESKKIYSKLSLRLNVYSGSTVSVYIRMDDGEWELVKEFSPAVTSGEVIPIVPRRCDRYSIKIEGVGFTELKSLTRRVRQGTFGKL